MTAKRWKEFFFGKPRDPEDPSVHRRLSLVALLAWVGLGADGLSSACYGPDLTFRALEEHRHLAPFLALAMVLTVSILSAAYANTIAAFPSGGGGYIVASRTLGRRSGMLCGCALVIDYVLTVAISVAAGVEAIFSFLPPAWQAHKVEASAVGALGLMFLNFRGVKESVMVLLPVFMLFLGIHAVVIGLALLGPAVPATVVAPTPSGSLAPFAAVLILLKAYSRGAGTYTGIEAVSNSLSILREPRVQTARRAMLYMALSLSVVAGGLLLGYLRMDVHPEAGKTLNAVLAERVFGGQAGKFMVPLTLVSEALLLLVAAQAGFIDGPRVLASMAVDSWVPRWFNRLSDQLVVRNGIFLVGLGGLGAVVLTRGHVDELVVLYSFSVFVTFLLSQAGMTRHWFRTRGERWPFRATVSGLAALLSLVVLGALLYTYGLGGAAWALAAIFGMGGLCLLVQWHYRSVSKRLTRLAPLVGAAEADPHRVEPHAFDRALPTAVFLVSGYGGAGMHTLLAVQRIFPGYFKQMVFVSVGVVDFELFKGQQEVEQLRERVDGDLRRYVELAQRWGYGAEARSSFGVDLVAELEELSGGIAKDYPRAVFFCGDLVFQIPTFLTGLLHDRTAEELQRRMRVRGLPLLILPIRV